MRQLPDDFDPSVKAALDDAKTLIAAGDVPGALNRYQAAWDASIDALDHHHASVIAHMAGVIESDPAKKHRWNAEALREADAAPDRERIRGFYASLHNNLAFSHAMLGELDEALRQMERAVASLADVEPGPYEDRVVAGTHAQFERVKAAIAERDGPKG